MTLRQPFIPFLDIRCHGFHRVATVSPRVHLSQPQRNAEEHVWWLERARAEGVEYVLFPELSMTGYSCGVLFRQQALRSAAIEALEMLAGWSAKHEEIIFTVGLPLVVDSVLLNVVATLSRGHVIAVVPKTYPPEGNEFDELRYFGRATQVTATSVNLLGKDVPLGTDLLIAHEEDDGFVLFHEICEDGWVAIPPSALAALHGATILTNSSASNYVIGKDGYREMLVKARSGPTQAAYMYVSAGYGETSSGMTWDNDALIGERGAILARAERFQRDGWMTITDIDTATLVQERLNQSSFRQNAADSPKAFRRVTFNIATSIDRFGEMSERWSALSRFRRTIDPHPFVPSDPATLNKRCEDVMNGLAMALARRLEMLPKDMRRIFLGYSGGRDSTLALLLAIRAMAILGLPRSNIDCLSMPGAGTSDCTKSIAERLPVALRTLFKEYPIMPVVNAAAELIGYEMDRWDINETTTRVFENLQALTRKHMLFSDANQYGMVLATGDHSEAAVGWCTYGADQFGFFNLNGNVGKTLVEHLIRWSATHVLTADTDAEARELLLQTLELEISPELLPPGADGKITQKSEEVVGPYELVDFFTDQFVRYSRRPYTIARLAYEAFGALTNPLTGQAYTLADIKHWLGVFMTRFFAAQWKRASMPEGVKIATTSLDPRGDWRMPSDASPQVWLDDLAEVPDEI